MTDVRFVLPEQARREDVILATYALELDADVDVVARVARFAVGQTTGTWVKVPGLTPQLRAAHEGAVVKILSVPPHDTTAGDAPDRFSYLATIAIPAINIGPSLPQLLTTLIGNDASTSMEAKLVDIELPDSLAEAFPGPRHGIDGVRDMVGVHDRPLVLNMLKPCTGLSPDDAAEIFYQTALGGIDLIKDDELMGNTDYSTVLQRVEKFTAAAERAHETTGTRTVYLPNISDRPDRMVETAKAAVDAGARALMLTYTNVGYGGMEAVAEAVDVPILGHFAGVAPYYEGPRTGVSASVMAGFLPRLAGADMTLVVTPYGGYPLRPLQYYGTVHQLILPRPGLKPSMPTIGGGVHPGTVQRYLSELGEDIILGVGGGIQGHPMGPAAGVKAMLQAIAAAQAGQPVGEAAQENPELGAAINSWGTL